VLGKEEYFHEEVSIDGLKVGSFLFADVSSPDFYPKDSENETILISHENRIDQYIVKGDRLKRFIGINTNIDLLALKKLIENNSPIDAAYLYSNRLISKKGRLVCSCEGIHEQELIDSIKENAVMSFADLKPFSKAGRTCGRCKQDIFGIIAATPIDPLEAQRLKGERESKAREEELAKVHAKIEKYNLLHQQ
jgi:quinone-reactive Ni/Fe-hydrogenase small subunit